MKCIKNTNSGNIQRVKDADAEIWTKSAPRMWVYCPKSEWKAQQKKEE
jgi:hypothetical protein